MTLQHITCTLLAALLGCLPPVAATPIHKCVAGGKVTYQGEACPSPLPRQDPDIKTLNAERRVQKSVAEPAAPSAAAVAQAVQPGRQTHSPAATDAPRPPQGVLRCDGRRFCSQMTSCAEARHFLAHCPGTQMDGDRNGVPCERQWCSRISQRTKHVD